MLLTQISVSPADLVTPDTRMPTFEKVIPQVRARPSEDTMRTYNTHSSTCSHTGPSGGPSRPGFWHRRMGVLSEPVNALALEDRRAQII
ncbi:hypothetical protein [Nocardia gamkensis]|uniref:hypothetical protein n=1 Tax=Nocardia gamkensis TaxID=352869 RepID=UPI0037C97DF6